MEIPSLHFLISHIISPYSVPKSRIVMFSKFSLLGGNDEKSTDFADQHQRQDLRILQKIILYPAAGRLFRLFFLAASLRRIFAFTDAKLRAS